MKKQIASFIFFLFLSYSSSSQTVIVTIGTDTTTNTDQTYPAPYGQWYTCSKHQMLIRNTELSSAGMGAGFIYSLAFDVAVPNGVALQNFTIKMKLTAATALSAFDNTGLTTVWGPLNYIDVAGWNTHTFSTPFLWDGSSNILIETCFCNGISNWTYNALMYNTPTAFNSVVYTFTDADANHCVNAAGPVTSVNRPNMRFEGSPPAPINAGITAITSPDTWCMLTNSETVTVKVQNFGTDTVFNIDVYYRSNGDPPVQESINDTILPGNILTYSFLTPADLSLPGVYLIDAWTQLTGDAVPADDSLLNYQVEHLTPINAFPYIENFESEPLCPTACSSQCPLTGIWTNSPDDDIDWTVDENGTPNSPSTGPALDNTTGTNSGNYLYTEASSPCNPSAVAILLSPCIDISTVNIPALSFAYHLFGISMGNLYIDVYSGGIWTPVDSVKGEQQASQAAPWLIRYVDLSSFSGIIRIRFRGVTGSGYASDMAIDDIKVYDKPLNDVGVISINSPNSGYLLTASENVSVSVFNYGAVPQDSIPVSYRIDGGTPITDTIFTTVNPGDTSIYTFAVTADLSAFGTYIFDAWTSLPGDITYENDSIANYPVINDPSITITIGTGATANSNTSYPAPYGNSYRGAKHQMLIRASELIASGMSSMGNVSALGFNVFIENGVPLQNFTIKIKNTPATATNPNFDNTGLTTVWGPQTYTETSGWNLHVFSTPFLWDGTSNLLIETCFNNTSTTNNARTYYTATAFNSSIYYRANVSGVCNNATGTTSMNRPNMQLKYLPDTLPPDADFTVDFNSNCSGATVQFTDLSSRFPFSWYWDFGDGITDTLQNPSHLYTDSGTYTVSLTITNVNGSDTVIKAGYIVIIKALKPPDCTPTVIDNSAGTGIYNVSFNTINNTTGTLVESYKDYSCWYFTTVISGSKQTLLVQTNPDIEENVRVWIDYNNDSIFNVPGELVFASDNRLQTHTGQFIIPQNVVIDTMLRMRVSSDYKGVIPMSPSAPCSQLTFGQSEDYGVKIVPNTSFPPEADFTYTFLDECQGIVQFNDYSSYFPYGWEWDFGDGNSGTSNPQVTNTFLSPGTYIVTLISTNAFGSDTITKPITIRSVQADFISEDTVFAGENVLFTDNSIGANSWYWTFGIGDTNVQNPPHMFNASGFYTVWLRATNTNSGCVDSISKPVIVVYPPVGINAIESNESINIVPIPSPDILNISYNLNGKREVDFTVINILGQKIYTEKISINKSLRQTIDLSEKPKGIYFVKIAYGDKQVVRKIILE